MIPDIEKTEADPFAADIFAPPTTPDLRLPVNAEVPTAADSAADLSRRARWSENLPRVRRTETNWNDWQRGLPPVFSGEMSSRITDALGRLLDLPVQHNIEFSLDGTREINQTDNFSPANNWWLTAGSGGTDIFFEFDDALAVRLTNAALGAAESSPIAVRPLTGAETAILEYLALNLAFEANLCLASPQIRFRRLHREIPDALNKIVNSESFSLLVYEFQAANKTSANAFSIYLTPDALRSFQTGGGISAAKTSVTIIESLPEQVKSARARFVCGAAQLTYGELAALESGDVVLFDNQSLSARALNFAGGAEILFGDGNGQKIVGELAFFDVLPAASFERKDGRADVQVSVRRINLTSPIQLIPKSFAEFTAARFDNFMTDINDQPTTENSSEEPTAGDEQPNGLAVENLVVALRVELEARRLPLSEIAGLRENQTLELSVRPTDEVNILIDERLVGRGELVLVENDRLGVRITKLMR